MSGIITIRDAIRNFLRKYDELISPIFKFFAAYIMFWSINSLYGYHEIFDKGIVTLLLSVISSLVSTPIMVLLGGMVVLINTFKISLEIGAFFLIMFIFMYCLYVRMFPHCGWVIALVPVMFIFKLYYAIPILVAIFVGASGVVPVIFGMIMYYFAQYTKDVVTILNTSPEDKDFHPYIYIFDQLKANDKIIIFSIVFSIVILLTHLIYKLPFNYSWYVAIAIGAICNVIFFMIAGAFLSVSVEMGDLIFGSIVGAIVTTLVQICKSMVDYSRKETVQFEDDEYFYYVTAIPKFAVSSKKKDVKKITSENVEIDEEEE